MALAAPYHMTARRATSKAACGANETESSSKYLYNSDDEADVTGRMDDV